MSKDTIVIRKIEAFDNADIEKVIRGCFYEFDIPLEGTAYSDIETTRMYQSYQNENEIYFVIEKNGTVFGGGGIKPLKGFEADVCEIQKLFFSPEVRGSGNGKLLFEKGIEWAKEYGYKQCYLESVPQLKTAIHIYESYGFMHLDSALGNTGHGSCGIWMIKEL